MFEVGPLKDMPVLSNRVRRRRGLGRCSSIFWYNCMSYACHYSLVAPVRAGVGSFTRWETSRIGPVFQQTRDIEAAIEVNKYDGIAMRRCEEGREQIVQELFMVARDLNGGGSRGAEVSCCEVVELRDWIDPW